MNVEGIIRKISVGDIKEGITYKVGQNMMGGRLLIEQITHDVDYLIEYGIDKYDVYVSENSSDNVRIWKSFKQMSVSVEYDISIDETA